MPSCPKEGAGHLLGVRGTHGRMIGAEQPFKDRKVERRLKRKSSACLGCEGCQQLWQACGAPKSLQYEVRPDEAEVGGLAFLEGHRSLG